MIVKPISLLLGCAALGMLFKAVAMGDGLGRLAQVSLSAALNLGIVLCALSLHEWAHGRAALALGDTTARDAGRLTLNPLAHFDALGLVAVPLALSLAGSPVLFGWAKPVPVDFSRLRSRRTGMAVVAAAGPAANLSFAAAGSAALHLLGIGGGESLGASALWLAVVTNLALGLVNLLPLYPMDGGRMASAAMPRGAFEWLANNEAKMFAVTFSLLVLLPWALSSVGVGFSPLHGVGTAVDAGIAAVTGSPDGEWYAPIRAWAKAP